MATPNTISLIYYGGDADNNRLNFYDASASYEGASRTLAILGHFYLTQNIIVKAPNSAMPLFIVPPEEGSLKQNIIAGVVGGLIVTGVSVPFTTFANRLIDSWLPPPPNPELLQVVDLLKEQNRLLRRQMGLPRESGRRGQATESSGRFHQRQRERIASSKKRCFAIIQEDL